MGWAGPKSNKYSYKKGELEGHREGSDVRMEGYTSKPRSTKDGWQLSAVRREAWKEIFLRTFSRNQSWPPQL